MKKGNKIIYKPEKVAKKRRLFERLLKIALSLLTFIATIALWAIFASYISDALFLGRQFDGTVKMFGLLFIAAAVVFLVMLAWEQYNIRMFSGKNRRKFAPPVPDEFLSKIYNIEKPAINILRSAKNICLEEDRQSKSSSWYTDDGLEIKAGVFIDGYQRNANL